MKDGAKTKNQSYVFWGILALIGLSFYLINEKKNYTQLTPPSAENIHSSRSGEMGTAQASKRYSDTEDTSGNISVPFSRLVKTGSVNDLLVDPTGKLWAATEDGVTSIFNDQTSHFSINQGRFPFPQAQSLAYDGQQLWVGSLFGLCTKGSANRFQVAENVSQLPSLIVWSTVWDGAALWIGTQAGIALRGPDGNFQTISKLNTNGGLRDNWCKDIMRIANWLIVAHDKGISLWNTSFQASNPEWWKNIDNARSGIIRPINGLAFDGRNVWIATSRGVLLLDTSLDKFFSETLNNLISYSRIHGLPTNRVNTLLAHKGSIWLGTEEGLARIKDEKIQIISDNRAGNRPKIRKLAASGDILWIGSDKGIQFINTAMVE